MTLAPTQAVSQFDECRKQLEEALSLVQTVKIANEDITKFHGRMTQQDKEHHHAMAEIEALQYSLYERDVYEDLEAKIRKQAEQQMEATIEEQVKAELKKFIPQDQQEQVSRVNQELYSIMIDLHNSESRRANSFLQQEMNKQLNTIKMPNGNVSEHFPKTLKDLFELDEERIDKLAADYPGYHPEGSPFVRVNQFLQFCGVRYQLVR